jgi:hypothetical protein
MIRLQYVNVASKKFVRNCQRHIILFIIFYRFINFKVRVFFFFILSFTLYVYFSL